MGQDVSGEAFRLSGRAGLNIPFLLRAGRSAGDGKHQHRHRREQKQSSCILFSFACRFPCLHARGFLWSGSLVNKSLLNISSFNSSSLSPAIARSSFAFYVARFLSSER